MIVRVLRRIYREVAPMVVICVVFSALFILGHLALYQEWPRWK
ncbi:hypothetical protein SEA_SATIS_86 [Streptomyces phage Satis]|nr:hypothetical protein SEA_SATIS_86 [Streptomyces phage Satis]QBZ71984.1 hypothetical protein SEA_KRADAL_86 [Streptomyces phage Kradal]